MQNYVDALSNGFQDDFPQQVQWLIKTTEKLPLGSAKGQMYYEWANLLFKESLVLMSEKKNFMKALYVSSNLKKKKHCPILEVSSVKRSEYERMLLPAGTNQKTFKR